MRIYRKWNLFNHFKVVSLNAHDSGVRGEREFPQWDPKSFCIASTDKI